MQAIAADGPKKMPVVRALDGVRAIAVLIVFLSHVGLGRMVPGGLGVTIFFFLSGYLITSLLYAEAASTRRIRLADFYLRRVLRIFPPLYLTLALSGLLVASGVLSRDVSLRSVSSQILFLSNYDRMIGDFRGLPGPPLWSLAVEEHFYLVFPLLFGGVLMHRTPRRAAVICLAACAVPLALRLLAYVAHWDFSLSYYYTHTRADSILFGCALALWNNPVLQPNQAWRPSAPVFLGALLFLVAVTMIRGDVFAETWRYTLQGCALYVIFGFLLTPNRLTSPILESVPLQIVGKFSYSFYLVHVLVFLVLHEHAATLGAAGVGIATFAISMIYCWLMFILVERPLARVRQRMHREAAPAPMAQAPA